MALPVWLAAMAKQWVVSRIAREAGKALGRKVASATTRAIGGRMKGYKTVTFNAAAAIVVIAGVFGLDLNAETAAVIAGIVVPAVNMALRAVTSTPIFSKE